MSDIDIWFNLSVNSSRVWMVGFSLTDSSNSSNFLDAQFPVLNLWYGFFHVLSQWCANYFSSFNGRFPKLECKK